MRTSSSRCIDRRSDARAHAGMDASGRSGPSDCLRAPGARDVIRESGAGSGSDRRVNPRAPPGDAPSRHEMYSQQLRRRVRPGAVQPAEVWFKGFTPVPSCCEYICARDAPRPLGSVLDHDGLVVRMRGHPGAGQNRDRADCPEIRCGLGTERSENAQAAGTRQSASSADPRVPSRHLDSLQWSRRPAARSPESSRTRVPGPVRDGRRSGLGKAESSARSCRGRRCRRRCRRRRS